MARRPGSRPATPSPRAPTKAEADADALPDLVDDEAGLRELIDELRGQPAYAVDTEFHREKTYFPKVALVQIAWDGGLVLVDPLAVDLAPFAEVLHGPGVAVMHAAAQDLEVMEQSCGTVPTTLFDTQLAAGFVGFATPALSVLTERIVGVRLPKASRLTDWLRRPLAPDQQTYAASDVAHLLELYDALRSELEASGRLAWVEQECEELRSRARSRPEPEEAWLRLKDGRHLRGRARGIAQEVTAWRERRAAAVDQPVRFVLPDIAIVGIAGAAPSSMDDLRRVRGLDDRHLREGVASEILDAVARGKALPESEIREARRDDLERDNRPAVALMAAWVSQLGRDLRIDPSLLATRADLVGLVAGEGRTRLAEGWRAELIGEPVRRLLHGEVSLTFEGGGTLVLEERSNRPVIVDLPRPTAPWTR